MTFVFGKQVRAQYKVSDCSLKAWVADGRIKCVTSPGGKRLYNIDDVHAMFGRASAQPEKAKVCYARVSSAHQQGDLDRQVEDLKKSHPDHEIIHDVGSGLNWKRHGFKALLERVFEGGVQEVVVAHRDRLCRFAFELVEQIFAHCKVKLVVLDSYSSPTSELSDDLLAITTVFVARHNGQRSAANRKKRKRDETAQAEEEEE